MWQQYVIVSRKCKGWGICMEIKISDLFAGVGAFRYGLERVNERRLKHTNNNESAYLCEKSKQEKRSQRGKRVVGKRGTLLHSGNNPSFRCVWANEWDRYAASVYRRNFGDGELVEGDIKKIDADDIPDHDILTAGFPCQAFSIAGDRKGFGETRGTLFFEIARIAEVKRPKILLLENVRGLLSAQKGYCFYKILQTLDELRYDVQWQCINGKHFLPQNRERVFIIATLRGTGGREIFPVGQNDIEPNREIKGQKKQTINCIDGNYWKGPDKHGQRTLVQVGNVDTRGYNSLWGRVYSPEGLAPNINAKGGGVGAKTGLFAMRWERTEKGKEARRNSKRVHGKDYTPFSNGHRRLVPAKEPLVGCVTGAVNKDCLIGKGKDDSQKTGVIVADRSRNYAGMGRNLESPKQITNILSSVQKDNLLLKEASIRRLTPTECERLMGFPDGWTQYGETIDGKTVEISDTQRYKMCGNSVITDVVTYLGELLIGCL